MNTERTIKQATIIITYEAVKVNIYLQISLCVVLLVTVQLIFT